MAYWPMVFRIKGSIINRVWLEVLLITLYTTLIVCLNKYVIDYSEPVLVPDDMVRVLGIVAGLLLVFRTNTAYDRYWEGRKLWASLIYNVRNLIRTFWVMIDDKNDSMLLVEKISMINLLVAFSYSVKHYLREEYSYDEEDMRDFINYLPRLFTPSSNQPLFEQEELSITPSHQYKKRKSEFQKRRQYECFPKSKREQRGGSVSPDTIASNIPLEISYYISSFIMNCKERDLVDSPSCRVLDTGVSNLVNTLTGLERIRRTPMPLAYSIHLHQITWVVLLLLPLEWATTSEAGLQWAVIPAMTLVGFALFGVLGIGRDIENPFGYDYNDLNLDDFCQLVHKEALSLMTHKMPKGLDWVLSEANRPIINNPNLTATRLAKMKYDDLQRILLEGREFKFIHKSISVVSNPDKKHSKSGDPFQKPKSNSTYNAE